MRRTDLKKSFIPEFSVIESRVRADYEREEALKLASAAARKAQLDVIGGKVTLSELAKELNLKHFVTTFAEKDKARLDGKPAASFFEKAYALNDSSLVLETKFGDDYYVVQLERSEIGRAHV